MKRFTCALICGLVFAGASLPAAAAPPPQEIKQVPEAADKLDLESLPEADAASADAALKAVFRTGCILFPGQARSYTFVSARGNNFYRVIPSFTFDVVMRVRLQGFRPVQVDRFFAGGIERFNFFSPPPRRLVTVTISGYRGSTGCFRFEARP